MDDLIQMQHAVEGLLHSHTKLQLAMIVYELKKTQDAPQEKEKRGFSLNAGITCSNLFLKYKRSHNIKENYGRNKHYNGIKNAFFAGYKAALEATQTNKALNSDSAALGCDRCKINSKTHRAMLACEFNFCPNCGAKVRALKSLAN